MYKVPGVIIGVGNSNKLLNITDLFALPAKKKKTIEKINMVHKTQYPDGLRKSLINVNLTNLIWNYKSAYWVCLFSLVAIVQW